MRDFTAEQIAIWVRQDIDEAEKKRLLVISNAEHLEQQEWTVPRTSKYPTIGDQLDDLYHAGAFSDAMTAKIKAVKDAHPKS